MSWEWILVGCIAALGLIVSGVCLANVRALRRELAEKMGQAIPTPVQAVVQPSGERAMESGNVFCRNCGNPYDSMEKACPFCHTTRA
ncbi:hypothetical protein LJC20_06005 [Eubacteriales bacterium OttesenSCG-928-M02]|nr:hypothetical protein [Eubacteriales bacterium OttesenSCG-928-M02]